MPDINDQHNSIVDQKLVDSYFTGEPMKIISEPRAPKEDEPEAAAEGSENEGAVVDDEKSDEEEVKVPEKELQEIDRVHYVVLAIENDCQIAPLGAFKMNSQHQVRRNEAFKGLSAAESLKVTNYCHFRNVQDSSKRE
jgi:hypothetical protein